MPLAAGARRVALPSTELACVPMHEFVKDAEGWDGMGGAR